MKVTTPILTKSELIEMAGITSSQFDNWRRRFLVPFSLLGRERVSLTTSKYSYLTVAYCKALSYHRGNRRSEYILMLKGVFNQYIEIGDINSDAVIAISDYGKGSDCGLFPSFLAAENRTLATAKVPIGKIITEYISKVEKFELVRS